MKETIKITSREKWLAERAKDVTSTEVSALFGLSPYLTEFELYHQKRDGVIVTLEETERLKWGQRLEAAIAHGAAEDMGWQIAKMDVYVRDQAARMGSSFDFEILSSSDGPGILEVKNVDRLAYRQNWLDDGKGNIEAPEHIELQAQHQMAVTGRTWCAIVVLVGGNEQKIVLRNRDDDIGAKLRGKVIEFWERVQSGQAPVPDYERDAEYIIKRSRANEGEDIQSDNELAEMIRLYQYVSRECSDLEKIKERRKAEILDRIGTASRVFTEFGTLTCGQVQDAPTVVITPEMVGQTIGGRKGYRSFRFTAKKEQ